MRPPSDAEGSEPDAWPLALSRVLEGSSQPRIVFQPVVDLSRGVTAGYEALSRFEGPPQAPPYRWFDEAERLGRSVELELRVVERVLRARATLPIDTFVTVNVTPTTLLDPAAHELLAGEAELHRLVFEVTEHAQVTDYDALREAAARVREAGGMLAVDDAGAGYASLKHILELRPHFVKLDRELITGIDTDPTKRSVVRMLGQLTSSIDAWVIAEGIETQGELDALLELGVPLGQGWALGRPAPPWVELPQSMAEHLQLRQQELSDERRVAALIERRPALAHDASVADAQAWFAQGGAAQVVVQLDAHGRAAGLLYRADVEAGRLSAAPVLTVAPSTTVSEVAHRAMNREFERRFDPVVCRRSTGGYAGIVTLERLVEWLARDRE